MIVVEKERSWRETTKAATKDSKLLWRLAKWGREGSHKPAETPLVPEIPLEDKTIARDHATKATIFTRRFFSNPLVSNKARQALKRIRGHYAANNLGWITLEITNKEVKAILYKTGQ